jgi:glycosyltransferase involved in cell wall biosynthesis
MATSTVGPVSRRPSSTFIAWAPGDSRPKSISAALGGEQRTFYDLGIVRKWLVPLRYVVSSVRTMAYLARRRPRSLIVQAPPVPAAFIAWLYARLAKVPVVIDSHPASFGLSGAFIDRGMLPLLGWLAPRVDGCIVTVDDLGRLVEGWGGTPLVLHEAPPPWPDVTVERPEGKPRRVLFISTFAPDEPLDEVIEAARRMPDVTVAVTGDIRRLPARQREAAPANVEWTGWLSGDDYVRALAGADAIVSLTDRSQSVPRSAYEAVYAGRPLVTSDWPSMHDLFPYAEHVGNDPDGIVAGIRSVLDRNEELLAKADEACDLQSARWEEQLLNLRAALRLNSTSPTAITNRT